MNKFQRNQLELGSNAKKDKKPYMDKGKLFIEEIECYKKEN